MISSKTDDIKAFYEKFNSCKKEISDALTNLTSKSDQEELKGIATSLLNLEKSVQSASNLLPGYDQRQYFLQLKELGEMLEKERSSRRKAATGKFSFTRAKKNPTASVAPLASAAKVQDEASADTLNRNTDVFDIHNAGEIERDFRGQADNDICIERCSNVKIRILGSLTALRIRKVQDSDIFVGPVAGSVFLEDCMNCRFHIACHQLRVHDVLDSVFFLHVTSKGIIEDCKGIKVAKYEFSYPGIQEDWTKSTLDLDKNLWNDIQDFNWLTHDTPSPNWSVME